MITPSDHRPGDDGHLVSSREIAGSIRDAAALEQSGYSPMAVRSQSKRREPRMIWFCWERQPTGNWAPVCYHGEKPRKDAENRLTLHEVPAECIGSDGMPMFGALYKRFPLPNVLG